jgi:hypothetical protein
MNVNHLGERAQAVDMEVLGGNLPQPALPSVESRISWLLFDREDGRLMFLRNVS